MSSVEAAPNLPHLIIVIRNRSISADATYTLRPYSQVRRHDSFFSPRAFEFWGWMVGGCSQRHN